MSDSNEFWEERYSKAAAAGSAVWSLQPNEWIERVTGTLPPGTAVDLAAGEGRNALWLAAHGWSVSAVDFSPAGLAIGRRRAAEAGLDVDWVAADATTWVAPAPVDLVVVAYLQLPDAALATALANAVASLAPGGTLAAIGHDRENLDRGVGGPQDPAMLWGLDSVRRAAAGLDIIECRRYERTTADGQVAIDTILLANRPSA
jgi:SAM-dependent methyltransferase